MDESLHTFIALASSFIAPLGLLNHFRMGRVEENDSVLHLTMYFLKFWLETYVLEELGSGVPQAELFACIIQPHAFIHRTDLCCDWSLLIRTILSLCPYTHEKLYVTQGAEKEFPTIRSLCTNLAAEADVLTLTG